MDQNNTLLLILDNFYKVKMAKTTNILKDAFVTLSTSAISSNRMSLMALFTSFTLKANCEEQDCN